MSNFDSIIKNGLKECKNAETLLNIMYKVYYEQEDLQDFYAQQHAMEPTYIYQRIQEIMFEHDEDPVEALEALNVYLNKHKLNKHKSEEVLKCIVFKWPKWYSIKNTHKLLKL